MQTIILYFCYIVLILLFSTAYTTSLIYCLVIWCLHTNKRRPCSSTLSGHPSSSLYMLTFSPHLCVGFLFLILYPGFSSSSRLHNIIVTHNFVTHHLSDTTFSHTTLSHTIFHTQLCHTSSCTHNFVTHHLSHTTFHTSSFTHNFVTHHLSHTPSFTHNFVTHHLSHTTLSHTIFHTQLCHTPSFTHNFVTHHLSHTTLSHTIFLRFTWQALHFVTSTFVLRGRRAYGTGLALVARLGRFWSSVTPQHFAWQAWHLVTPTFVSRRRGTSSHPPPWHFAWQAWHLVTSTFVSRGRRGTWRHLPSFCVAGVPLMALGWLWWLWWLAPLCHTHTPSFTHHH